MSDSSSDEGASKKQNKSKKSKKSSKKSRRKEKLDAREGSSSPHSSDSSSTERRKRKEKKAKKKAKKRKRNSSQSINQSQSSESINQSKSPQSINQSKSFFGVAANSSQVNVTGPQETSSTIADRLRLLAEPTPGPLLADAAVNPEVKPKGPMTKAQWDKHQNTFKRVHDPETGRTRLIRGDGEVMEEMVSRDMHIAINKAATKADGAYFETVLGLKKHK